MTRTEAIAMLVKHDPSRGYYVQEASVYYRFDGFMDDEFRISITPGVKRDSPDTFKADSLEKCVAAALACLHGVPQPAPTVTVEDAEACHATTHATVTALSRLNALEERNAFLECELGKAKAMSRMEVIRE